MLWSIALSFAALPPRPVFKLAKSGSPTSRPTFTLDAFIDRPRADAPKTANDPVVLGVFVCTCLAALVPSIALMARHYGL
jgi:hypothetical protein